MGLILGDRRVSLTFRNHRRTRQLRGRQRQGGLTVVELLVVVAILLTIAALAVPNLVAAVRRAKIAKAVGDIHSIGLDIQAYELTKGVFPNTLADISYDKFNDPWHHPYQYLNFANVKGKGKMRKDRFLVPINTFFDLYSMGEDGKTVAPLTAKDSQDDVIRANDGDFIGLASDY